MGSFTMTDETHVGRSKAGNRSRPGGIWAAPETIGTLNIQPQYSLQLFLKSLQNEEIWDSFRSKLENDKDSSPGLAGVEEGWRLFSTVITPWGGRAAWAAKRVAVPTAYATAVITMFECHGSMGAVRTKVETIKACPHKKGRILPNPIRGDLWNGHWTPPPQGCHCFSCSQFLAILPQFQ